MYTKQVSRDLPPQQNEKFKWMNAETEAMNSSVLPMLFPVSIFVAMRWENGGASPDSAKITLSLSVRPRSLRPEETTWRRWSQMTHNNVSSVIVRVFNLIQSVISLSISWSGWHLAETMQQSLFRLWLRPGMCFTFSVNRKMVPTHIG